MHKLLLKKLFQLFILVLDYFWPKEKEIIICGSNNGKKMSGNSIAKFIDKYKNRRPHSSFGKIPPAVYHKNILNNLVSGIKFAE